MAIDNRMIQVQAMLPIFMGTYLQSLCDVFQLRTRNIYQLLVSGRLASNYLDRKLDTGMIIRQKSLNTIGKIILPKTNICLYSVHINYFER